MTLKINLPYSFDYKDKEKLTRIWNKRDIDGDLSMKSTLSSDSQWNDFKNNSSTNSATNFGDKSSLKSSNIGRLNVGKNP